MLLTSVVVQAERAQPLLVDVDLEAGDVGQVAEADRGQLRVGVGGGEQLVARVGELLRGSCRSVFSSSMVKPLDWPRPRIAPGTSANTCASRRPRNAPDARCDDRVGAVLLALALVQSARLMKPWPVFWPRRAAAAAAGDGEIGLDVLLFGPVQEIILDCLLHLPACGSCVAPGGKPELDLRGALVLGRQEAGRQPQEHRISSAQRRRRRCRGTATCGRPRG